MSKKMSNSPLVRSLGNERVDGFDCFDMADMLPKMFLHLELSNIYNIFSIRPLKGLEGSD
jgi:hypothetical protein